MNRLIVRTGIVIPLITFLLLPLASCQNHAVFEDLAEMQRPPCESLEPVHVEDLDELAAEDCDREGQGLIFPDGMEIEVTAFGSVWSSSHGRPGEAAVYTVRNYGSAGVMASWTECSGDQVPVFYGDPKVIDQTLDVLGLKETAPNRCSTNPSPATSN